MSETWIVAILITLLFSVYLVLQRAMALFGDGEFHSEILEGSTRVVSSSMIPSPARRRLTSTTCASPTAFGAIMPDTDTRWLGGGAFVIALDLDGRVIDGLNTVFFRDPDGAMLELIEAPKIKSVWNQTS